MAACAESIHRLALARFTATVSGKEFSGGILGGAIWAAPLGQAEALSVDLLGIGQLLMEAYSHLDLEVRRQLSPLGKALHRLLTGLLPFPGAAVLCPLEGTAAAIGYRGPLPTLAKEIAREARALLDLGWLSEAREPSGPGRAFVFRRP